jgi:hypothetical protein
MFIVSIVVSRNLGTRELKIIGYGGFHAWKPTISINIQLISVT